MISNNSDSAFEVVDYGYDSRQNVNYGNNTGKDSYVFPSGSKRTHTVNANTNAHNKYQQINSSNNNSFGQPQNQLNTQPLYTIREQNPSK